MPAKPAPPKPAAVKEVELGASDSIEKAWAKLGARPKLGPADREMLIDAHRAERLRWQIGDKKKRESKSASNLDSPIGGS